jgi:hypothetical protein
MVRWLIEFMVWAVVWAVAFELVDEFWPWDFLGREKPQVEQEPEEWW